MRRTMSLIFVSMWNRWMLCVVARVTSSCLVTRWKKHPNISCITIVLKMLTKRFSQIKVDMEGGRIRTHSEVTTDGKIFVIFIDCVIRSCILNKLRGYLGINATFMKKVLAQLSNIMLLSSTEGKYFTKAFTKKQKQILVLFDVDREILHSID